MPRHIATKDHRAGRASRYWCSSAPAANARSNTSSARAVSAPDGRELEVYVGGDYSYRSAFFTTPSNSIYSLIPEYDVVNLRLGLRFGDGKYDVQVFGRNVFDEVYYLTLSAANTGGIYGTLGDPRTYGVTLKARY